MRIVRPGVPARLEAVNFGCIVGYEQIRENERRSELMDARGAETVVVAFGAACRIA